MTPGMSVGYNPIGYNPMYYTAPQGGMADILATIVSSMTGRSILPSVSGGQSVAGAMYAHNYLQPQSNEFATFSNAQFGSQFGHTLGNILHTIDPAGYSRGDSQNAIRAGWGAFGSSLPGSFVMPMVDTAMSSIGLTGGSILGSSQIAFQQRMALGQAGAMNPYDMAAQRRMTENAAAFSKIVNGMISPDGGIMADPSMTKGISRESIFNMGMRMASAGAFNYGGQSFGDQIHDALGDAFSVYNIDDSKSNTDFGLTRGDHVASSEVLDKLKAARARVREGVQAATDTLGAMRDLLGDIGEDKLMSTLDDLTGGSWARSAAAAKSARGRIREVDAMAKMYNLDPTAVMQNIGMSRSTLRDSAGFTANDVAFGFDGGGMFRLGAQSALFEYGEQLIDKRGVRGDPFKENQIRMQNVQAMARNMNTSAGAATQQLAYGHQIGVIDDDTYKDLMGRITSGDEGERTEATRDMHRRIYGSSERGMQAMRDATYMKTLRQSLDDDSGRDAIRMAITGASNEWADRERRGLAQTRFNDGRALLGESGQSTTVTDEEAQKLLEGLGDIDPELKFAALSQYNMRIKDKKQSPTAALSATLAAVKQSAQFRKYATQIDESVTNNRIENDLARLDNGGRDGFIVNNMLQELQRNAVSIGADKYKSIRDKLSKGDTSGAFSALNTALSEADITQSMRVQLKTSMEDFGAQYDDRRRALDAKTEASSILRGIHGRGAEGTAVMQAQGEAIRLLRLHQSGELSAEDYKAALEQGNMRSLLGDEWLDKFSKAADAPDSIKEFLNSQGLIASALNSNGVDTIRGAGYGFNQTGFFSGGAKSMFSGSGNDALKQSIIKELDTGDSRFSALRKGLAERVLGLLEGNGDIGSAFGAVTDEQKIELFGSKEQQAAFERNAAKVKEQQKAFDDVDSKLSARQAELAKANDYGAVSRLNSLRERARNGETLTDKDLEGLADGDRQMLMSLQKARSEGQSALDANAGIMKQVMNEHGDVVDRLMFAKSLDERKYANSDSLKEFIQKLDTDGNDARWADIEALVGSEEVDKAAAGKVGSEQFSKLSKEQQQQARREAARELAMGRSNFAGAVAGGAADSYKSLKEASSVRELVLRGTLVLQNGDDKAAGEVDAKGAATGG